MVSFDTSIYTPGFGISGREGKKGLPGKNGKALFFVPYDLRLGNNVDMALYRIKNNISFDDSAALLPENRPYQNNDEFVDINGNIYRVNEDKTDFDFIKTVKPSSNEEAENVNLNLIENININGNTLTCTVNTDNYDVWKYEKVLGSQGRYYYPDNRYKSITTTIYNIDLTSNPKPATVFFTFADKKTRETFIYEINIPS